MPLLTDDEIAAAARTATHPPSPEETARRSRVNELSLEIADLISDMVERLGELRSDLDLGFMEIWGNIRAHLSTQDVGEVEPFLEKMSGVVMSGVPGLAIRKLLSRLFAEAPKLEDGRGQAIVGQAPALECHVLLRHAPQPIYGALSVTAEGTLRMMSPSMRQDTPNGPARPVMCEQFFEYEDVVSVMVERDVGAAAGSKIITS